MQLGKAVLLVCGIRNRCPAMPGSVPMRLTQEHREALSTILDNITIVMGNEEPTKPEVAERDAIDLPCTITQEEVDEFERRLSGYEHSRWRADLAKARANPDNAAPAPEAQREVPVQ